MSTEAITKTIWAVDPMHSEVQFKVRHLVISTVTGNFNSFSGTISSETEDFNGANVEFTVDVNSIDTNVADRDGHLRSPDFFDVENYPNMTFKGVFENGSIKGDLTLKDVTKTIELDAEYGGTMVDGYGNTKAGFEITGKLNRKDYGLTWSQVTEAGGVVVGDEVKLSFNIQVARS